MMKMHTSTYIDPNEINKLESEKEVVIFDINNLKSANDQIEQQILAIDNQLDNEIGGNVISKIKQQIRDADSHIHLQEVSISKCIS